MTAAAVVRWIYQLSGGKKVEADERGERREETQGGRLGWLKEGNERPEAASQGQAHNGTYSSSKQDGEERKGQGESSTLCPEAHCCLKWTREVLLSSSARQVLLKKEADIRYDHLRISYLKGRQCCGGLIQQNNWRRKTTWGFFRHYQSVWLT